MIRHRSLLACSVWMLIGILALPGPALGAFRFLTQSLPDGRPDNHYTARLVTADAGGPVTFSVSAGALPPGLALDAATGRVAGVLTANGSFAVTFDASDGTATVQLAVSIDVGNTGAGGGPGPTFGTSALLPGRVGTAYSQTLGVATGIGPFLLAADNLPPGLTLNGQTGAISGTPIGAGRFDVALTVIDQGDSNRRGLVILPLVVLPADSDLELENRILDGGEIGLAYSDTLTAVGVGGQGGIKYAASGLPPGLTLDNKGDLTGTPTAAGTYLVHVSATKGGDTFVRSVPMWIAFSSASNFIWEPVTLPPGVANVLYDGQPPITVATQNGVSVTYSATGLPPGISYDASDGELTGTPTRAGVYPVTFTATDSGTGENLTLEIGFPVLPASGGDTNSIARNFWIKKQLFNPGKDIWKAIYFYNSDRRTGQAFDPATEGLTLSLGSRTITLAPGQLVPGGKKFLYRSARGVTPVVQIKMMPAKQTIKVKTSSDTLTDTLPTILANRAILGSEGLKVMEFIDARGSLRAPFACWDTACLVSKGKLKVQGGGADSLKLSLLLWDPSFQYTGGTTALRFRLLDGVTVLVDRTFTSLVTATQSVDAESGMTLYRLAATADGSTTDRLTKFLYDTGKGKLTLKMTAADLSGLTAGEAHVTVELTVGDKTYTTGVTLFERKTGSFSTKGP